MNKSPLLELCPDISNIILKYVETIKNNQELKKELEIKIKRSLVKNFTIQCKELSYHRYVNKYDTFLYYIPSRSSWVWKGKRFSPEGPQDQLPRSAGRNLYIRRIDQNRAVCCTCFKPCKYSIRCLNGGSKLPLLRFPSKINDLNRMGYYNLEILMNELIN